MNSKPPLSFKRVILWHEIVRLVRNPLQGGFHLYIIACVIQLRRLAPTDMGLYWTIELGLYWALIFANCVQEGDRAAREPAYYQLQIERGVVGKIGNLRLLLQTAWVSLGCTVGIAYSWFVGATPTWVTITIWVAMICGTAGMMAIINSLCLVRATNPENTSIAFNTFIFIVVLGMALSLALATIGIAIACTNVAVSVLAGAALWTVFGTTSVLLYERTLHNSLRVIYQPTPQ